MRRIKAGEGEEPISGFLQTIGDRAALEPSLAQEGLSAGFDLCRGVGLDHVAAVFGQLVVEGLRRMGQEVAVLMNRAALNRQLLAPERGQRSFQTQGAVHDHELGPLQAARIEVVEEMAPGGRALPAHVSYGRQNLLTIAAHALLDRLRRNRLPGKGWLPAPKCSRPSGPAES